MVITDRFVYLHIPKTGGTFVESVLARVTAGHPGTYVDTSSPEHRGRYGNPDQHERYSHIPVEHRRKPLLLTVRNPYDHHVSLYEFGWWKHHARDTFDPDRIIEQFPHFPDLSFAEYLTASLDWKLIDERYAPPGGYEPVITHDVGPLTFDFIRFLAPDPDAILSDPGRFMSRRDRLASLPEANFVFTHELNQGLAAFLLRHGYEESRVNFIHALGRITPEGSTRSQAMDWTGYYTPESKRLVRQRERVLFELFPAFDV